MAMRSPRDKGPRIRCCRRVASGIRAAARSGRNSSSNAAVAPIRQSTPTGAAAPSHPVHEKRARSAGERSWTTKKFVASPVRKMLEKYQ